MIFIKMSQESLNRIAFMIFLKVEDFIFISGSVLDKLT